MAAEIADGPPDDPGRLWTAGAGREAIRDDVPIPPAVAAWDLGAGETAVLAAAWRQADCAVVVDDHAARQCAKAFGIHAVGTVGVLLLAKRRGLIAQAAPLIRALPRNGCHITRALVDEAIRLVGEE